MTGLSRVTIRRYLDAGRFPNAFRDVNSTRKPAPWRIPAQDLRRLGLSITEPAATAATTPETAEHGAKTVARLEVESAVNLALATERLRTVEVLIGVNERLLDTVVELAIRRTPDSSG